jgi:intracellular septation protein A
MPVVLYVGLRAATGPQLAIGAAFIAMLIVYRLNRRTGALSALAALTLAVATIASAIGIALNSDTAFLLRDPIGDFITVAVLLGSIFMRRPFVGLIAREVAPGVVHGLDLSSRLFSALTLLWAAQILATGGVRIVLLTQEMSPESYLIMSRATAWPAAAAIVLLSLILVRRAIRSRPNAASAHPAGP